MRDDNFPRAFLERSSEPECLWRLSQGLTESRGEGVRVNEIARDVFVDSLDDHIDEPESRAASDGWSVRRTQWCDREKGCARKFRGKRGSLPRVLARRAQVDEGGIDQHPPKYGLELLGRAG